MAWPFMRIILASMRVGPSPRCARSQASCVASYTWQASVPSTITPGMPYAMARAEAHARHHADQLAQHRNGRAHVASLPITEVRRGIASPGRRISLGHVLPHDV